MQPPATTEEKSTPVIRKSLRILYAEDVPELGRLVKTILGRDGHVVEGAANGLLALKRLSEDPVPFDAIITDHHMPKMDGLELVKRLRQMAYPGHILVFSSELSPAIAAEYEGLGVDLLLPKPVSPSILREKVAAL